MSPAEWMNVMSHFICKIRPNVKFSFLPEEGRFGQPEHRTPEKMLHFVSTSAFIVSYGLRADLSFSLCLSVTIGI